MEMEIEQGGVRGLWKAELPDSVIGLAWLGQAGFALRYRKLRLLIDPYLSDHLARKYKGAQFPHVRMMPPPIQPEELRDLDLVLCSHRHSDHMDPGSLPILAQNNPKCRFVVPRAETDSAIKAGISEERIIDVNAGEMLQPSDALRIRVIPAAHEGLKITELGEHHFLGFILRLGDLAIYHSGDCVRFAGQVEELTRDRVDLALLPVNGRDAFRTSHGIIGNMTFDEAAHLCRDAKIPRMIPHHFSMFEFNTIDLADLQRKMADPELGVRCILPDINQYLLLR